MLRWPFYFILFDRDKGQYSERGQKDSQGHHHHRRRSGSGSQGEVWYLRDYLTVTGFFISILFIQLGRRKKDDYDYVTNNILVLSRVLLK